MSETIDRQQALFQAAEAARYAPSVHNTQPWRWVVSADRLELFAAAERHLQTQDADGHMLQLSCGNALHYARVALAAEGWQHEVDRPADSPLAVIRPTRQEPARPEAARHFQTLHVRHTDRRTVSDKPVGPDVVQALIHAVEQEGSRLHLLDRDEVIELAVLVEHAQKAQATDERLQAETATWVGGERADNTGVPSSVLPTEQPRTTVAERDFGTSGTLQAGEGHDTAATYAVLYGSGDEPVDWLRAGEALSALWLTATERGAAVLPNSSPVEVPFTRHELRRLIGHLGFPYLVLRLGTFGSEHAGSGRTPRLPVEQIIEVRS
jgi:nitroreductase